MWTPFVSSKQNSNLGEEFDILRSDSEKTVLINISYCEWRTEGQTPLEELKLQKFHGILYPEGEWQLHSDLYGVWTGIHMWEPGPQSPLNLTCPHFWTGDRLDQWLVIQITVSYFTIMLPFQTFSFFILNYNCTMVTLFITVTRQFGKHHSQQIFHKLCCSYIAKRQYIWL